MSILPESKPVDINIHILFEIEKYTNMLQSNIVFEQDQSRKTRKTRKATICFPNKLGQRCLTKKKGVTGRLAGWNAGW